MLKALIMLETWAVPSFSTLNMETAGLTTDRYRFVVLGALLALALLCVAGCAGTNGESSRAIDDNAALPPPVRPVKPVEPRPFPEGPRKVVLGTTIFSVFRPWSGLEHRLEEIAQRVDLMAEDASKRYGRGLDLAVFPENAVNPGDGDSLLERAVELDGPVAEMLGAKAREHGTYLVVSFNMIEELGFLTQDELRTRTRILRERELERLRAAE